MIALLHIYLYLCSTIISITTNLPRRLIMILTKTKAAVYGLVILAVGYVAGAVIGNPTVDENLLDGDIKKVRVYNNVAGGGGDLGGGGSALAEKMLNDSAFQTEMIASLVFLNSRVLAVDSLANATLAATGGGGLETLNTEMKQLAGLTGNACKAFDSFMQATESVLGGNPVDNYDLLLSNAQLAFFAVDNQVTDCSGLVDELAANGGDFKTLAGDWVRFGAENALIGSSDEALDYWVKKYNEFFPGGGGGGDVTTALGKSIKAKADATCIGLSSFLPLQKLGRLATQTMGKQADILGLNSASTLNMHSASTLNMQSKSTMGKNAKASFGKSSRSTFGLKQRVAGSTFMVNN